jgi:hypothetical protein
MRILEELLVAGGSIEKTEASTCKISYWHIPNGTDYDMVITVEVFFNDIQIAESLCEELMSHHRESLPVVLYIGG